MDKQGITEPITDETLMALADGELPQAEAVALRVQVASDPDLAARVAGFRRTREVLAGLSPDPVPMALEERIRAMAANGAKSGGAASGESAVVDLAAARSRLRVWHLPASAAAALVLGLGFGFLLAPQGGGGDRMLADALTTLPSGETAQIGSDQLVIVSSFTDEGGSLCREYELVSGGEMTVSVACHSGGDWQTRLAVAAGPAEGFVPASTFEVLDGWLSSVGASAPMTEDEEIAALGGL